MYSSSLRLLVFFRFNFCRLCSFSGSLCSLCRLLLALRDAGLYGVLVERLREVDAMDRSRRAECLALTAKLALLEVDISDIVDHMDRIVGTCLLADSATDTCGSAGLLGSRALVLVRAGYEHPHSARSLRTKLDYVLWASLGAGAAGSTFFLVDDRKTGYRVHGEGTELTGSYAVSAAEAAECAGRIAGIETSLYAAG